MRAPSVKNRLKSNSFKLPLYWIIGHGRMYPNHRVTIPKSTYVAFISRPGYQIATGFAEGARFASLLESEAEMRKYINNEITNLPAPFLSWENRTYGPGDSMPEAFVELWDNINPNYARVVGVKRVGGGTHYRGRTTTVGAIIRRKGPGIYFVFACRQTPEQELTIAGLEYLSNLRLTGGQQTSPFIGRLIRGTGVNTRTAPLAEQARNVKRTLKQKYQKSVKVRKVPGPRNTRNANINRLVMNQRRLYPMAPVSELRNLAHQVGQLHGRNYTVSEISNSIRRLQYNNYM